MMFRSNFFSTFLAVCLLFGPIMMASAERKIKYLFNSTTDSCTSEDNEKIDALFATPVGNRRHLRSLTNEQQRELWPRKCARDCFLVADGRCYVTDCVGYRRELTTNESRFFTCDEETNDINQKLQMLIDNGEVTESCKRFLDPIHREVSCYDNVIYGVVENVRLWNMSTALSSPVLITDDLKGTYPICKSLIFNIEAKVNDCVDFVRFQMEGPNYSRDHTEPDVPYSLFADSATNPMWGKRLYHSGLYNLTIIPDGFASKTHTVQLQVMKC